MTAPPPRRVDSCQSAQDTPSTSEGGRAGPGADRQLEVTHVSMEAKPNGDRYLHATVRNLGPDSANYAVWLGGISS